jgi:hypothetical protein
VASVRPEFYRTYVRWRPDTLLPTVFESSFIRQEEKLMYFGGGILGTILIIALIVYLVRRA